MERLPILDAYRMQPTEQNHSASLTTDSGRPHRPSYTQQDVDLLFTTLESELQWLIEQSNGLPPIMSQQTDLPAVITDLVNVWWSMHQESQCILYAQNRSIWERDTTRCVDSNHNRDALVRRLHIAHQLLGVSRVEGVRELLGGEVVAIRLLTILIDYYENSLTDD